MRWFRRSRSLGRLRRNTSDPYAECPLCGGEGVSLGGLGNLAWYRCRDCGIEFNRPLHTEADLRRFSRRRNPRSNVHRPMRDLLRQIRPEDLDWHAARWTSARTFQEAVERAWDDEEPFRESDAWLIRQAAEEAETEDGADWGNIPSLGGEPERVWWEALQLYDRVYV